MKNLCYSILICFLAFPFTGKAQHNITGVVYNAESKTPIELANVYISNSTKGSITDKAGKFALNGIPVGQSELVISCIGFETQSIIINNSTKEIEILLQPKYEDLQTVTVEPYDKNGWKKWGRFFLEYFIGTTEYSFDCKILNTEAIKFHFSKKRNMLRATSDERLIIENKSLGYILKYDLSRFEFDFDNKTFLVQGHPLFEEMYSEKKSDQNKWIKNRNDAYYGSMMQFMRSLYHNQLDRDRFEVRRIINASPTNSFLVEKIVPRDSLIFKVDSVSVGLNFRDHLQVVYALKEPSSYFPRIRSGMGFMRAPQTSQLTLNDNVIKIYENGSYYDGTNLVSSGYWSWSEKMANLLPLDFEPTVSNANK
jgi:hypothetical protein